MQAVKELAWLVWQKLLGYWIYPHQSQRKYTTTLWKHWVLSQWQQEKVLNEAANNLKRFAEINNPENIVNINNKHVAKVAVTVYGTWQKRGHNYKIGVVFILSVDTGEII